MSSACACHTTGMSPTAILMEEHRVIERVLDAIERAVGGSRIDREFFTKAIDFLRSFADGCHHHKEEDELFPLLESAGLPREGGPIGCMLHEHEEGRALIRTIAANVEAATRNEVPGVVALSGAASRYIALLRQHIRKEDTVLFRIADQMLGPEEQELLKAAFHRAERTNGNAGKHEYYLALADELCRSAESSVEVL